MLFVLVTLRQVGREPPAIPCCADSPQVPGPLSGNRYDGPIPGPSGLSLQGSLFLESNFSRPPHCRAGSGGAYALEYESAYHPTREPCWHVSGFSRVRLKGRFWLVSDCRPGIIR